MSGMILGTGDTEMKKTQNSCIPQADLEFDLYFLSEKKRKQMQQNVSNW